MTTKNIVDKGCTPGKEKKSYILFLKFWTSLTKNFIDKLKLGKYKNLILHGMNRHRNKPKPTNGN